MSQKGFSAALLAPELPEPSGLTDGRGAPAGRRFAVYRNNVTVSLIEALEQGFPVIAKLIGAENFRNIAREYVRRAPPSSPLMMLYGAGFADFLEDFAPLARYGYLPDVARLEFALRESYHAADAAPIAPDALAAIAPENLAQCRLGLAPSVRLICSPWPVYSLWLFNMREGAPKPPSTAQDVVVLRPEYDPEPQLLGAGGGSFLKAIARGETLGQAAVAAGEDFDLGALLAALLSANVIAHVSLEV